MGEKKRREKERYKRGKKKRTIGVRLRYGRSGGRVKPKHRCTKSHNGRWWRGSTTCSAFVRNRVVRNNRQKKIRPGTLPCRTISEQGIGNENDRQWHHAHHEHSHSLVQRRSRQTGLPESRAQPRKRVRRVKPSPGGKTRLAKRIAASASTRTTGTVVAVALWALRVCATARRTTEAGPRDRSLLAMVAPHPMVGGGSLLAAARGGVLPGDDVGRGPQPEDMRGRGSRDASRKRRECAKKLSAKFHSLILETSGTRSRERGWQGTRCVAGVCDVST